MNSYYVWRITFWGWTTPPGFVLLSQDLTKLRSSGLELAFLLAKVTGIMHFQLLKLTFQTIANLYVTFEFYVHIKQLCLSSNQKINGICFLLGLSLKSLKNVKEAKD